MDTLNSKTSLRQSSLLLFPPNWSACVSGPHLALPLIAGALKREHIDVSVYDLSEEFYRLYGHQPDNAAIRKACDDEDIGILDDLYFKWEDSFLPLAKKHGQAFGLLSGFNGGNYNGEDIDDLVQRIEKGTVYSEYFDSIVRKKVVEHDPGLVGISISSYNQIFSAVELILRVREWLPKCKIVLGGNILTRLRDSRSFGQLEKLVDRMIIYQGDAAIIAYYKAVFSGIDSDCNYAMEKIDYNHWPTPYFKGLNYGSYPGGVNTLSYVSARGCYYGKCSFCAIPAGWAKGGYAGSAPGMFAVQQIKQMIQETGLARIKFVDEAFIPSKCRDILKTNELLNVSFEWEAYARVETAWESRELLSIAYESGCRRLYFGLEIAPDANRKPLLKNDKGNIMKIMERCKETGILVHLFCMVGHPGTSVTDAELTVKFLIDHQHLIDTSDLVGFRLDRGTSVIGVKRKDMHFSDLAMSYDYEASFPGNFNSQEVNELEFQCQEMIWDTVPRLLHPLYRIGNRWGKGMGERNGIVSLSEVIQ